MPYVRFTRDRRGYEHTFLVQPTGAGSQGDAILYWFRTPPDIRVGRSPLDREAVRAIEAAYPTLRFDWARILEAQAARATREDATPPATPDRSRSVRGPADDRSQEGRPLRRRERRPRRPSSSGTPAGPREPASDS